MSFHYINMYEITNLHDLDCECRYLKVTGLPRDNSYDKNLNILVKKLAYELRQPVALVNRGGDHYVVIPVESPLPEPDQSLTPHVATLVPVEETVNVRFDALDQETLPIGLSFLRYAVKGALMRNRTLWSFGNSYYVKTPTNVGNGRVRVDIFGGFKYTIIPLESKRLFLCVDLAYKYIERDWLTAHLTEQTLDSFRMRHFLYCFDSRKEALPLAELIPGSSTEKLLATCRELNVYVVIGLLERDGDKCYNTAVLLGPNGLVGKHRKLHRPYLGVDRFLDDGDLPLTAYDTDVGRIGMGICYDMMFPEQSRVLALLGADILVFPANWPETGKVYPDYIIPTRATENHVYCVAVNRVGEERGTRFLGRSMIACWLEPPLAEGKPEVEDILYAEVEPARARQKLHIFDRDDPDKHRVDFIKDRRPEFYGRVCKVSSKLKGRH